MYLKIDALGPKIKKYMGALNFKNSLLRHWPTETVDGEVVMGKAYWYNKDNGGVQEDEHIKKLYKILGQKQEELYQYEKKEYKRLLKGWYYLSYYKDDPSSTAFNITSTEVAEYINANSIKYNNQREEDWHTIEVVYDPNIIALINTAEGIAKPAPYLTNTQILELVKSDPIKYLTYTGTNNPKIAGIALLDKDEVLFKRSFTIVGTPVLDTKYTIYGELFRYVKSATILFRFIRKTDADTATAFIDSIRDITNALDDGLDTSVTQSILDMTSSYKTGVNSQLMEMYLYYAETNPIIYLKTRDGKVYVKKSALEVMVPSKFVEFVSGAFKQDAEYKKSSWLEKALAGVIVMVAIIASFAIGLGMAGTGASIGVRLASWAIAAGAAAMTVKVIALVAYWSGRDLLAAEIGEQSVVVDRYAEIAGIVAVLYGGYRLSKDAIQGVQELGFKEYVSKTTSDAITKFNNMSIGNQLMKSLEYLNHGFQVYSYLKTTEYEADKKELLDESSKLQKELDQLPKPTDYDLIEEQMSSPTANMFEMMTQEAIDMSYSAMFRVNMPYPARGF